MVEECGVTEEWVPVMGGVYEVSRRARVRRATGGQGARSGHVLRQFVASTGYLVVNTCINGKKSTVHVHALVADAFIGARAEGMQINHRDGEKMNNDVSNLEYVTHAENMAHAGRLGLVPSGDQHWNWKGGAAR